MIVRPPIPFVCERLYAALCTYPKLTVLGKKYFSLSTFSLFVEKKDMHLLFLLPPYISVPQFLHASSFQKANSPAILL